MKAVDLFAGPGGWDLAATELGITITGIEHDADACQTRRNAGFTGTGTRHADVTECDPADYTGHNLIASPPCPAFSSAGTRDGIDYLPGLAAAISRRDWAYRPTDNPEVWLALEIGRWYDTLDPDWIALEQVPAVLPLWETYARLFADHGYSTWTGVLNAADYGVPQTRQRAILIASRRKTVGCPPPTHAEQPAARPVRQRTGPMGNHGRHPRLGGHRTAVSDDLAGVRAAEQRRTGPGGDRWVWSA